MKLRSIIAAATLAVSATATAQHTADLQAAIQRISQEPAKDKVLYELQAGTLALDLGERDAAAQLFDRALTGITAVYAQTEQAADARSAWENEGSKVYKGEPYERAMAFYYRGLLDMFAGDYENARASFKSGILQDAFAEEAQHQADFALLMFWRAGALMYWVRILWLTSVLPSWKHSVPILCDHRPITTH